MKNWVKFFTFHILYFIIVGFVGGLTWIWVLREIRMDQGLMAKEQVRFSMDVLEMAPGEFHKMQRLLNKNRLPINEREKLLFDERERLREERQLFQTQVFDWESLREETLARIREQLKILKELRAQVDASFSELKDEQAVIRREQGKFISDKYQIWIDIIKKMEPAFVANSIKDREAKEIVQDLRQLKSKMAADVYNALRAITGTIQDNAEKDEYIIKMNDVTMLLRAEGLQREGE